MRSLQIYCKCSLQIFIAIAFNELVMQAEFFGKFFRKKYEEKTSEILRDFKSENCQ